MIKGIFLKVKYIYKFRATGIFHFIYFILGNEAYITLLKKDE